MRDSSPPLNSVTAMETPPAYRSHLRVLIAGTSIPEDSRLDEFLSRLGAHAFEKATSYPELVQSLTTEQFDLILTDLHFDAVPVPELLRFICASDPGRPLVVFRTDSDEAIPDESAQPLETMLWPTEYPEFAQRLLRILPALNSEQSRLVEAIKRGEQVETHFTLTSREFAKTRVAFDLAHALHAAGLLDHNTALRLELVFQEAVANAHEHGNLELPSEWREEFDKDGIDRFSRMKQERLLLPQFCERTISVNCRYANGELTVEIRDQGPGFLTGETRKKEETSESVKVHGRGLSIIHSVMDGVEYRDRGSHLIVRKFISGSEAV
ncbi:MAG: ATP-binding protein [Bdellovibrionales bacterium]|nr:ATP-binding protein [Bdellovibrionales bacterium]